MTQSCLEQLTMQTSLDYRMILTYCQWGHRWQMKFNVEKCKVMHLGCHNTNSDYYTNGQMLQKERLGIVITDNGKVAGQCEEAYSRAN